jgi:hypothetical protein
LIVSAVLCFSGATRGQQPVAEVMASASQGSGAQSGAAGTDRPQGFVGDNACQACHQREFESFVKTRHHGDSALPSAQSMGISMLDATR